MNVLLYSRMKTLAYLMMFLGLLVIGASGYFYFGATGVVQNKDSGSNTKLDLTEDIINKNDSEDVKRNRDFIRESDITLIHFAFKAMIAENKPLDNISDCTKIDTYKCTSFIGTQPANLTNAGGAGWIRLDLTSYLATLPTDPLNGENILTSTGKIAPAAYYLESNGTNWNISFFPESEEFIEDAASDGGASSDLVELLGPSPK
jgi:hypothetical protein